MAIRFGLQNWGDWHPWHNLDHLSSSSSSSIRTWNHFIGEPLTAKSAYRKVEQSNAVGSYWIDYINGQWQSIGHTEQTMKLRNYNSKFAKDILIQHLCLIYIHWIATQNALHREVMTYKLPSFTKTPGILTSCQDLIWLIIHGMI